MDVGICGMGRMGRAAAVRLLARGHRVSVWNRTPGGFTQVLDAGARETTSPRELASTTECVLVLVSDAEAVSDVLVGPRGLLGGRALLVQSSTLSPLQLERVRALCADRACLDAPVVGSVPAVLDGTARILCGGPSPVKQQVYGFLGDLGAIVDVGGWGAGTALKTVVNAANAPMVALLGQALALGMALGVDRTTILDELGHSRIGALVEHKRAHLEDRPAAVDSRLALFAKDMELVEATARAYGIRHDLATVLAHLARDAVEADHGDADYSAVRLIFTP